MNVSIPSGVLRLLLTSDLHLGRTSSRLPESVTNDGYRASDALNRIVDLAIREQVDLVCMSGDIADESNKFWEAIGPLEYGINRLAESGIRTIAVAGNHDYEVLGKLADQFDPDKFLLLGRGGVWERHKIDIPGKPELIIDGWSFPRRHVQNSPLENYDLACDLSTPILGMVHGDLNAVSSNYAPIALDQLQAIPISGWLLGHIHASRLVDGLPWILYPGSPQAFDPGEAGSHGVWTVEVVGSVLGVPRLYPLSSIRYSGLDIDLGGVSDDDELIKQIIEGVRDAADRIIAEEDTALVCINLRLKLVGETSLSADVPRIVGALKDDLALQVGAVHIGVETVENQTLPSIDLEAYARQKSAPGAVARMLLDLDGDDASDDVKELIQQTREDIEKHEGGKQFTSLARRDVTNDMAREHLRTQGRALLARLVGQDHD
jgi:DNA repair exonuclease SbcCD nuclease subunit